MLKLSRAHSSAVASLVAPVDIVWLQRESDRCLGMKFHQWSAQQRQHKAVATLLEAP